MHHIAVVKTAQHMDDGIRLPDIAQKLVAQSLAFGGTLHKAGNVDNLHRCRNDTARMDQFGQARKPFVGNGDDSHVRLDGAEREIGGLGLGVAQAIEKCRLAHIGKSDYATL